MKDKIEIPLSKTKIFLLLIGATIFIIIGILLLLNPEQFESTRFRNIEMIRIVGIASIVFFGICLAFILRKLFESKIGLTIDEEGITDNSNATSVGLIEWADIIDIGTVQVASTKILMLKTDKPGKYIERAKNRISKSAMKANNRLYGSPLSITSNSLKIKHNKLEKLIIKEFEKRK